MQELTRHGKERLMADLEHISTLTEDGRHDMDSRATIDRARLLLDRAAALAGEVKLRISKLATKG